MVFEMQEPMFRLSLKAFIQNERREVLVVKETGRTWWDLPGGGMDENENIQQALVRELKEEIGYDGKFTYDILSVEDPHFLTKRKVWQARLVFKVTPESMNFSAGIDGDEIAWKDTDSFEFSESGAERLACYYGRKVRGDLTYDPLMPVIEQH